MKLDPTEAQIDAAQQSLMEVKEVPGFGVHVPKAHIRAALIAANAAADPVDTTELREQIARAMEPHSWSIYDAHRNEGKFSNELFSMARETVKRSLNAADILIERGNAVIAKAAR